MSGIVAYRIAKKMKTQLTETRRGLTSWELSLANFAGFMDCMQGSGLCTDEEREMMVTEFTRLLLEPVII